MSQYDFYLSSSEHGDLSGVFACRRLAHIAYKKNGDVLLIECTPSLPLGPSGTMISRAAIAARHVGFTLSPVSQFPMHVHVLPVRQSIDIRDGGTLDNNDIVGATAWATIYASSQDARDKNDPPHISSS